MCHAGKRVVELSSRAWISGMRYGDAPPNLERARVPWVVLVVASLTLIVAITIMFLGGSSVGVTWDERIHALMLDTYFTLGWYASPDWLVNGELDAFTGKWPYFVYAPVASLIGHFFAALSGAEQWGGFSESAAAYSARHLGTAVMALLGVIGVGILVRVITGSWRWGLVGAALLASIPMWVGHGMFNIKDLPVATGYTLATLSFVCILRRDYGSLPWLRVSAWTTLVIGVVLAVGTRPASGLPLAITGLLIASGSAVLLIRGRNSPYAKEWSLRPRIVDAVGPMLIGYLLLVVVYPNGFANVFRLVKESLLISGRFPVNDPELTNGEWLAQPPPWFYLPTWFGAQLTLLVIFGCIVFCIAWVVTFFRLLSRKAHYGADVDQVLLPLPVMGQALMLPLLAVAVQSTIYNGVRQFIFVVPAVAAVAALGLRALVRFSEKRAASRSVIWVMVCLGLVVPVIDQVRLYPYTYTYFNELATVKPINGNWATDYWRASSQELTTKIPKSGAVVCRFPKDGESLSDCSQDASYAPFWDKRGSAAGDFTLEPGQFWLVRENYGDIASPNGCDLVYSLSRTLRWEQLIIGQVFRCDSLSE